MYLDPRVFVKIEISSKAHPFYVIKYINYNGNLKSNSLSNPVNIPGTSYHEYLYIYLEFLVNPDAIEFISNIPKPISIISIVGLYRTGKSYLLNKMLLNKSKGGFQVGSTINACTKGLWIWP